MNKQVVVFKKNGNTVVAIRVSKEKKNDRAVVFEIVSATDSVFFQDFYGEVDPPESDQFNILNSKGEPVASFEEGLYICTGKIFPSNKPQDLINNKGLTYTIQFEEDLILSKSDLDSLFTIISFNLLDIGYAVINEESVEEYVYTVE